MAHLTEQDRCKLENFLNAGLSPNEIAMKLGKAASTIRRELKKHRQENEEEKRSRKNFCIHRTDCSKKNLCAVPPGNCLTRCSRCKVISCNKICSNFLEDVCEKLGTSPFVCNGCGDLKECRKRKFFYLAQSAMKEYTHLLSECRKGIDVSPTEMKEYDELIKAGGRKGQAIHHIMAAHPDTFQKCEKTIYNYFNRGLFSLPRGDMPRMCMRKTRNKKEKIQHKIDQKCRIGRTIADYSKFCVEHPDTPEVQIDSVIGRVGGKVLLTIQFEFGMMLAYLRDSNNSQSVIDYFNMLECKFGLERFRTLFPVILTDNGSEFSNPAAIETSPFTNEQRTRVFYCDPNSSWQKGEIENNHTNLRRILDKGESFDNFTQQDIDLAISHLNSYLRKGFYDIPCITKFNKTFGEDILEQLHITLIHPDNIILDPSLLKK